MALSIVNDSHLASPIECLFLVYQLLLHIHTASLKVPCLLLPCRCTQSTELIKHLFEMSFEAGSLGVGRRNALWSHTHDKIVLKVDPYPITVHLGLGTQDPLFW
jgi:hypothetical protein